MQYCHCKKKYMKFKVTAVNSKLFSELAPIEIKPKVAETSVAINT